MSAKDTPSDIKDRAPNKELVVQLESFLKQAKSGEIRSMITVIGWNDDCVTTGWVYDNRSSPRRLLAQLVMTQHDFIVNIGLHEGDTVLSNALTDG